MARCACMALLLGSLVLLGVESVNAAPFAIRVVDEATGRGVPLVELRTVAGTSYYTDNAGLAAIDEAALVNQEVFFSVSSHGYEFAADGFGIRGKRLSVKPGTIEQLAIQRKNIAERLYRVTGAGLYEHAVKLGQSTPLEHPLLNSQVAGSDTAHCCIYRNRLFWIWGDTNRIGYPLGNFSTTGAISQLSASGGLAPELGVNLTYFGDDKGFVKGLTPFKSPGPVWLTAMTTLKDDQGAEHLVATYLKIKGSLTVDERGLCEWNDDEQVFREVLAFPKTAMLVPEGHCFTHTDGKEDWLYVGEATPELRMPARYEAWRDPRTYEQVNADQKFREATTETKIDPHHGHVAWSASRKKWVSIFCESGGASSYLGEIWYAEAERPAGPWRDAVKIITHDKYSFYNPVQHPYFADDAGRYLYLEGTYTATFSGNERPTPLYEYNQIMYRVDLTDPRLQPAQD